MFPGKFSEKLSTFILSILIILFYYSELIFNPNAYLTADAGDGIKAFYVFLAHIKNDTSYSQFEWMNYPYGQTHIFTDGQTIIANLFKWIGNYFPFVTDNAMGIYNLLMVFSFPFCALILCSIIQRLRMPFLFTVLGSIVITFLSPQIFRMFGHPTLSYVCFFPLAWWMFIRYHESKKRKVLWSLLIAFNSAFWFFVHPYYIMLSSLFYLAYWLVGFLQHSEKIKYLKNAIVPIVLQIILPLVATRIYVNAIDIHQFRSQFPYGFWDYYAEWNTVFMPSQPPFDWIYKMISKKSQEWEGLAYIGLPAVFVALFSLFKILRYLKNKNFQLIGRPVLPPILKTAIWGSYFLLLFSMCLPFQLGLHALVDHLSFIRQFRSLGRFAWVFYYVFTVYALYIMFLSYRYFKQRGRTIIAYALTWFYFAVSIAEANSYQKYGESNCARGINYFDMRHLPDEYRQLISQVELLKGNYQCLIPLPFYHMGSENFGKGYTDISIRSSMVISYWSKVPMLSSSAARSPILEAKNIMQFFSPPWFKKEIEKDLPNTKDFLILYTKEELNNIESGWLAKSKTLWTSDNFELRSLPYDSVFRSSPESIISRFEETKGLLSHKDGLYSTNTDFLIFKNYDGNKSRFIFRGNGALMGVKKDFTFLLDKDNYKVKNNSDYMVSFWLYNKDELRPQITCVIEKCDEKNQACSRKQIWSPGESMIIDGDWSLVERLVHIEDSKMQFSLFLNGTKYDNQEVYVDDFMFYAVNDSVYLLEKNNKLIFNNVQLSK